MYTLNEQQYMVEDTARKFGKEFLVDNNEYKNDMGKYRKETYKKAAELGLLGTLIPEEYSGLGLGVIETVIVLKSIAEINPSFAISMVPGILLSQVLIEFGNDEQKKHYLPKIASGEILCSFAVTEPNGGSNWFLTSKAIANKNNKKYHINGSKSFISNAPYSDLNLIFVRTNIEEGVNGFSAILVENGTKGFLFGSKEDKIGLDEYYTGELVFDECIVPEKNLIGKEGDGLKIFQFCGNYQCVALSSIAVGISKSSLDESIEYCKKREFTNNDSIAILPNVQFKIAEIYTNYVSSELMLFQTAHVMQQNEITFFPIISCMNNIKKAVEIADVAMEVFGGSGCSKEFKISKNFLDSKTLSLYMTYDAMMSMAGKMILS